MTHLTEQTRFGELEELLLPDLLDRINQLSLRLPSLREQGKDLSKVFQQVWEHMRFAIPLSGSSALFQWLNNLPLDGNYRDLEKIAILLHHALHTKHPDPISYAINGFKEFSRNTDISAHSAGFNFRRGVKLTTLEYEYRVALREWALSDAGYGSKKKAQEGLGYRALDQLLKVKKD